MTPTEKLSDLKRRIDEAMAYEGTPVSVHHGNREYYDAIAVKHESTRILSRLIERMPPDKEYTPAYNNDRTIGFNALRAKIISIITEDLT